MHILCFIAFLVLLIDMIVGVAIDYEDIFLVAFVGITMFIGLLASWISYDLKTLWLGLGISYLLMYLAVSELYNKKDVITGLPNRNAFEKAMAHARDRYNTILMIDMNSLKKYNDTMGHTIGDQYIYATAKTLDDAYDGLGKLYRVGGDEFCLISKRSEDELRAITQAILKRGRCDEQYGDFPVDFAYGIGVRRDGDRAFDVYKRADELMYENKKASKTDLDEF
jgi:diguanylate cyclase (GGDEF)-like protein